MRNFDKKSFTEVILHILNKTGGIDAYHIYKILYFAEMNHLAEWGHRIIPDEFHARENGPVPELLYQAMKHLGNPDVEFAKDLSEVLISAKEDADNIFLAKREADYDCISDAAIDALNQSIEENAKLSFDELRVKSHDNAWREVDRDAPMSRVSIAREKTNDKAMLEYIKEHLDIERALA